MREWLPTASINMTVQSSELSLSGFDATPCLNVMCNLTSIARGRVALKVKPASDANEAQNDSARRYSAPRTVGHICRPGGYGWRDYFAGSGV